MDELISTINNKLESNGYTIKVRLLFLLYSRDNKDVYMANCSYGCEDKLGLIKSMINRCPGIKIEDLLNLTDWVNNIVIVHNDLQEQLRYQIFITP